MEVEQFYKKNLKHNFMTTVMEGAFTSFAGGMVPLATVLTYFVSGFVSEKWIIGLLPCLFNFLVFCPQVLLSKKIEGLRAYKSFAVLMSFLYRLPWLLLALDVYFFADSSPKLFIVIFYILYSLIGLTLGFNGLTTLCLISKVIPDNTRGRLMATKSTVGGIFQLAGSLLMGIILKIKGYPINYAVLFAVVFISSCVSLIFMSAVREKEVESNAAIQQDSGYIKKMFGIIKEDVPYTFFMISIIFVRAFGTMPFAFQTVYAKDKLGISSNMVFIATIVLFISQIFGYIIWGYIGDKINHKISLLLSSVIFIPAIFFTFLMTNEFIFLLSIFLLGISQSAGSVNLDNLSISLCEDKSNLPTYIGLRCLVTGPFMAFSSLLGGFIIDHFGYSIMFLISAVCILPGLYLLAKVKGRHAFALK